MIFVSVLLAAVLLVVGASMRQRVAGKVMTAAGAVLLAAFAALWIFSLFGWGGY